MDDTTQKRREKRMRTPLLQEKTQTFITYPDFEKDEALEEQITDEKQETILYWTILINALIVTMCLLAW